MDTSIRFQDNALLFNAGLLERECAVVPEGLATTSLRLAGQPLEIVERALPECIYDGLLTVPRRRDGIIPPLDFQGACIEERASTSFENAHAHASLRWTEWRQHLQLVRCWTVYPGIDAMVTHAEIASESLPQTLDEFDHDFHNVVEALPIALVGWKVTAVSFFGRTDYHNTYTSEEEHLIGEDTDLELTGSLLFLAAPDGQNGLFILHEAPPENERRPECSHTFHINARGVEAIGWGIGANEILPDRLRRSYSVAVGAYTGGENGRMIALRTYLKARFPIHENDLSIVVNPWGDGKCYEHFSEAFLLEELTATGEIGATHYQIDDGWQAGGMLAELTCNNAARPREYWDIDPVKFPNGFEPLVERARQAGVGLALWFAPDVARGYRNWEEERDILLDMHRRYGIELVKIDGIRLYSKDAEENLIRLLTSVSEGSEGRMRFNLDVTNGLRLGHFTNQRFGTIFVENRYLIRKTDAQRVYYPWRVLKNLWEIARYVPPERVQFEFANLILGAKNTEIPWDPTSLLTPHNCSWEYVAAVPLMAGPLCWLEPSSLPADTKAAIRKVLDLHRAIAPELGRGCTLPIGQRPDGHSWTGFHCFDPQTPESGLLAVYREDADSADSTFDLANLPAGELTFTCLSHPAAQLPERTSNGLRFQIESRNAFRLYRYRT